MTVNQPMIQISNVSKRFGDFEAIKDVSLSVPAGSFTTLLGPSGCGKTTLMKLIAGFVEPDAGQIHIEGRLVNGLPAFKRNTPLVFQDYALFPHMTVEENIAYGLKLQKLSRSVIAQKITEMVDMFGLQGLQGRLPRALSGGQQQRVAFARALVMGSKVILMDEPLSNLDAKMRVEVRDELRMLQQRLGFTAIFVTHDQDEALSISDYVAVFNQGRIVQAGTPREIYYKPASIFAADFVGTANFGEGVVTAIEGDQLVIQSDNRTLRVQRTAYPFHPGDAVVLVIRPETITMHEAPTHGENAWSGFIQRSSFLGHTIRYWVNAEGRDWVVDSNGLASLGSLQGLVHLSVNKQCIHVLPAEQGAMSVRREEETLA